LTAAHLEEAVLDGADLRNSKLECAESIRASFERVALGQPRYQDARPNDCPSLLGASLDGVQLQGALLDGVDFRGASLIGAQLQAASIEGANLRGASLSYAQLQGASLNSAQLEGTALNHANLQGASLDQAALEGSWFSFAKLQGASLAGADLETASLAPVLVWRADIENADVHGTRVRWVRTGPKQSCENGIGTVDDCAFSYQAFGELKESIEQQVPESERRTAALARIQRLNPANVLETDTEPGRAWLDLERVSPAIPAYDTALAHFLLQLGCDPNNGPYVLSGVVRILNKRPWTKATKHQLAVDLLKDSCPTAKLLPGEAKATLVEMAR
jgi:uncharacterized protein YjbI with pentapeptide repeats